MKTRDYNRDAWNRLVEEKNRWTLPVSSETIARARGGDWQLVLTPTRTVPREWYPSLQGTRVLCLAGGGGQQGPILAAAGAEVTVFDNSDRQLEQDRVVAARDGLSLRTVEGDMRDLGAFTDESFDFIFHPCSNCFVEDIRPVWREAFRVLARGGTLAAGFSNPLLYLFDPILEKTGVLQLKFRAPFSDLTSITAQEKTRYFGEGPLTFGHTLEDQIGGQLAAGFHLIGLYEDDWGGSEAIDRHIRAFIATLALKP